MKMHLLPKYRVFLLLLVCIFAMTGTVSADSDEASLKLALLPIPHVLPVHVAQAEGYFEKAGIQVIVVPVASGLERDQLMQSGQIDGMLNELTTTAMFNRRQAFLKIVTVAHAATEKRPLFRLLAAPGSGIKTPAELAGKNVGISMNTIIDYLTDRMLAAKNVSLDAIKRRSVPVLPERFQLMIQGKLDAAVLPDPMGMSAIAAGAVSVVDDTACPDKSVSVISFSQAAIKKKAPAIRSFLTAWNLAVESINKNPENAKSVCLEKIRVPPNIQAAYVVPVFGTAKAPTKDQWDDVMAWMTAKKLIDGPLSYEQSVDGSFLP